MDCAAPELEDRIAAIPRADGNGVRRPIPPPLPRSCVLCPQGRGHDDVEPRFAVTPAGEAHHRDGRSHDLLAAYRDSGRSLKRMVAAIAGEQLG